MKNNIEKILVEKELSKLVIDLVWSATDGGCKLKESDFSHFEEPLYEWTALVNKFSTSITQALAEERESVVEDYTDFLIKHGYVDSDVYTEEPKAVERYLSSLEKNA